jgi:hypothetical protein
MSALVVPAVILTSALAGFWLLGQGRLALSSAGAVPVAPGSRPRLENLVHGLAGDLGVNIPSLWAIPSDAPNALVSRWPFPIVAVSDGVLTSYTRTELEAVVAHCLVRVSDRTLMRRASVAVALGRSGGVPVDVGALDRAAAGVTRYPPALASAIEKAHPSGGRFAPFWFVAHGRPERARDRRAAEVRDL